MVRRGSGVQSPERALRIPRGCNTPPSAGFGAIPDEEFVVEEIDGLIGSAATGAVVAALALAVLAQDRVLVAQLVRRAEDVAGVGVARHEAEQLFLSGTADGYG